MRALGGESMLTLGSDSSDIDWRTKWNRELEPFQRGASAGWNKDVVAKAYVVVRSRSLPFSSPPPLHTNNFDSMFLRCCGCWCAGRCAALREGGERFWGWPEALAVQLRAAAQAQRAPIAGHP